MELKQNVNIHNKFDIEVRDAKSGEIKQKYTAYNIILNQMWTRLCGGSNYFSNIHFGTGNGTPSPERTTLFSYLGTKSAVDVELIKAVPLSIWKRKIVLNPEEYVGSTIREVGIAFGSTASNLVTHAMLKDSEGNPISITKTDIDVITIYATVFVTFSNAESIIMQGIPANNALINYLVGGASAPTGSFGLLPLIGAATQLGSTGTVTWTSDVSNKKRKTNVSRFGINDGNGHVKVLEFTNLFAVKFPAAGIFIGQPYVDVNVGVGDGTKSAFTIPSNNVNINTIVVKIDGVQTTSFILEDNKKLDSIPLRIPTTSFARGYGGYFNSNGDVLALACGTQTYPYIQVFDWVISEWVARPVPPNWATSGYDPAFSSDGRVLAVVVTSSAPYVKIYDWNGTNWTERTTPPNVPAYGHKVSLNSEGTVLAFASYTTGERIKIYDWTGTVWTERVQPPNVPSTCNDVALSSDGNVLAIGASTSSPYIKIYDWTGTVWTERVQPPNVSRAEKVKLNADGTVLAFSTSNISPYIKVYDWNGTTWIERTQPPNINGRVYGFDITDDGSVLACALYTTSPYFRVYDWDGFSWVERNALPELPTSNLFGYDVSLTATGDMIVLSTAEYSTRFKIYSKKSVSSKNIVFDTAPATGQVITADYTVDGVHKTEQFVIDASFAIQFGEGV